MPNVQHNTLTGSDSHEPKGASSASANTVYLATGSGSGVWQKIVTQGLNGITSNGTAGQGITVDGSGGFEIGHTDHGSITFVNVATPLVVTTPTVPTLAAPTTVPSGHSVEITESTTGRLTYFGTHTEHVGISCHISFSHTGGADRDVSIYIAKNGTIIASTEQVSTCNSTSKVSASSHADINVTTNDYLEVFVKISGTGDVNVHCYQLDVEKV